jgi:hypothetical protein
MFAISRSLMMQPKLLVLDEPRLGLAPVTLEQRSNAVERLRRTTPRCSVSKASSLRCSRSIVGGSPCNGGATTAGDFAIIVGAEVRDSFRSRLVA